MCTFLNHTITLSNFHNVFYVVTCVLTTYHLRSLKYCPIYPLISSLQASFFLPEYYAINHYFLFPQLCSLMMFPKSVPFLQMFLCLYYVLQTLFHYMFLEIFQSHLQSFSAYNPFASLNI